MAILKDGLENYCCCPLWYLKEKRMSWKELTARLIAARKVRARNAFIVAAARKWRCGDNFVWVQFIPKSYVNVIKKFYLPNFPPQINMTLIYHVQTLTYLKWQDYLCCVAFKCFTNDFNLSLCVILLENFR